jgi:hypothetical protein
MGDLDLRPPRTLDSLTHVYHLTRPLARTSSSIGQRRPVGVHRRRAITIL